MRTDNVTIGELTTQMVVEAKQLGFSEATMWRHWMPRAGIVTKYYREQGLCVYDPAVTDEFLQKIERRCEEGEVTANYLRNVRQITGRLNEFYLTGALRMDVTLHGTKYVLSSCNERLVDLFVVHQGYGKNTRDDAMRAVRKYLCHFERLGHETLATVTIDDVQRFILKVASEVKTSTLHDLFLYLQHFHTFLKEISINDEFDSDKLHGDTGGIRMAVKYLVSEFYSRDLSIKYKSAKYVKFRRGEYQSKLCPYGYRKGQMGAWSRTRKPPLMCS